MKHTGRPTTVSMEAVMACQQVREARMALPSKKQLARRYGMTVRQVDYAMSVHGYKWIKKQGDKA